MCREPLSLVWFIEHLEATAVEDELERDVGRWRRNKPRGVKGKVEETTGDR